MPRNDCLTTEAGGWILLGGCNAWVMTDHAAARLGFGACPVCRGLPLAPKMYCIGCDRSGLDGRVTFPGLDPDEARDPEWSPPEWVEVRGG